jgi:hypothetical protein
MRKGFLYKTTISLIVISFLIGCSKGISDDTITQQVINYLQNDVRLGFMSNVSFSKFFKIENVIVKDKLIKDNECIAICGISVKIKKLYAENSAVTKAYSFIVGDGRGSLGESKANDVKFLFEKYEKGWKIRSNVK